MITPKHSNGHTNKHYRIDSLLKNITKFRWSLYYNTRLFIESTVPIYFLYPTG